MSQQLLDAPSLERSEPEPAPAAENRRRHVREVLVTLLVCVGLWAVLFGPVLERNAETGPVGARRSAALAVLRPFTALSDALGLTGLTKGVLRSFGKDPREPPGGVLDLPEFDIPVASGPSRPEATGPEREGAVPTTAPERTPSAERPQRPEPTKERSAPSPSPEPSEASMRLPTAQNKLRIAVVGDSLAQGLGPAITRWFAPDVTHVLSLGRQSTGLARQDYFNWPRAMREVETEFRPDLVFVMLGTNDNQAQISPDGETVPVGSTAWVDAYGARATAFLREATSRGTRVIWVGVPVVEQRQRWGFYRRVNAIYASVARSDPLGAFVDSWELFEGRDGGYAAYLRNERGALQQMRAGDGFHLTPTGYAYLARASIRVAAQAFGLPEEAVTFRI